MKNIIVEKKGNIAIATINRPEALNALNTEVLKELEEMARGIEIEPGKIAYADVTLLDMTSKETSLHIILYQGMNRQIRKMVEHFGYEVKSLKRIRHATIVLDGLKRGEFKPINPRQIKELKSFLDKVEENA